MGNLCGKEESTLPASAGHVLGSTPASSTNARVPAAARPKAKNSNKPKVTGPGRTLGPSSLGSRDGEQPQPIPADARMAAALAAEVRTI